MRAATNRIASLYQKGTLDLTNPSKETTYADRRYEHDSRHEAAHQESQVAVQGED